MENNKKWYYVWGFSGVDHEDEDDLPYREPDFVGFGEYDKLFIEGENIAYDSLASYGGLHGLPNIEDGEDEFYEEAQSWISVYVEEVTKFDKEHPEKDWDLSNQIGDIRNG